MWWCVAILLVATNLPHAHVHAHAHARMLLNYEHLEPDTLPWAEVGTDHHLDPQVAQVRLAMLVVETARALAARPSPNYSDPRTRPHSQPQSQPHSQTVDLAARVKGEVYKKVLQQALAHTRKAHEQLVSSVESTGLKESILKHWLGFVTGSDMAHRVLYSLKDERESAETKKEKPKTKGEESQRKKLVHESKPDYKQENPTDKASLTDSDARSRASREKLKGQDLLSLLMGTLMEISGSSNSSASRRFRRSDQGLMYLPIGGTTKVQCPTAADAAGVSIAQMAFLSICLTVFNVIVNINNNINNNNNNNNINSDNNLSNNNAELSLNVNNAGQVNVMLPPPIPGRKRRTPSLRARWQGEPADRLLELSRWAGGEASAEQALEHILRGVDEKPWVETRALGDGVRSPLEEESHGFESDAVRKMLRTATVAEDRQEPVIADDVNRSAVPTADNNSADSTTRRDTEAVTEPNVGDAIDDFRLPTPLPGALRIQDRTPRTHTSSTACEKDGRRGVASGLLRAVKEWALESPLLPLQCRGLLWCRRLKEASARDVWLLVLASFATHQRTSDRQPLTLRQFTAAALADDTCDQLFPTCRQTAVL
ncbi:uncharacterized protein LOC122246346 [Penaeus japonicus]|uniref:uncharacterized protein LOC122246346 n=1 Tax=Penaeus japonicus TaxID=27405 RepID=UPI001C7173B1|nr:uncharacterized protein LOC122246346 [Penaeus japonicus]